ncbi:MULTISPECIES: non-hydrolyzing UDP-N-acetylglucosamine 2-epimerase [unclassified Psychrobacillus]|uniref:non-hydrolyzing UDP-N-acetylglucosamine 2-epimerase n=1 Tax=unclassified Psychrobacillus TaxID=2636677 RepID=UPI0012468F2F|nr:UDP-N-acetylglucosamine 2-epimerase (non-hydrolyzing) [Psychrobacillus sp. AK 1817]QEY19586.1 UDP-N-acetylglucosamine 2-epimerase (non-hydrolyzing) [Psychrobacillus sp. AK 1817]QGM30090.1 UDP-N-acetylglucosamine 2-epimerase (non-hydrolyzing) [Bacillus sp. N3536]
MKVMIIFGTRPEGIKFAPIIKELQTNNKFETVLVNTGQHIEMLDQVLSLFSIKPEYELKLMKTNQKLEELSAELIQKLGEVLDKEKPDLVFVLGDTATTFAGAYTSFLKRISVAHVEAGLRTHNISSPFPEEMYRRIVTKLSDYHFAPTEKNKENLLAEGIPQERIIITGNSVIDALYDITNRPYVFPDHLQKIFDRGKRILLVTTHRRENFIKLKGIYEALTSLVEEFEDIEIIFPVHPNPNVRKEVKDHFLASTKSSTIHIIEPLDYECFAHVMKKSYLVITDSGGIQEEAPALDIPVLVIRESTERTEGVKAGTLKLVGTEKDDILQATRMLLNNPQAYENMAQANNPYGDGTTSEQISSYLDKIAKKI